MLCEVIFLRQRSFLSNTLTEAIKPLTGEEDTCKSALPVIRSARMTFSPPLLTSELAPVLTMHLCLKYGTPNRRKSYLI